MLASYAVTTVGSRGRDFPEDEHPLRSAFQRDRDRIVHTTAFRRLEYKTQVFVNHEGDYYRTRLTHTLEVAQIGRTIARALRLNEDLIEAICLSHDLGHPPFGHAGETALNALHGRPRRLRPQQAVAADRRPSWSSATRLPGLNLTWEVREGIVKHESRDATPDAREYGAERLATWKRRLPTLADALAYNAHDLDDGLRSGLLTWDRVCAAIRSYGDLIAPIDWPRDGLPPSGLSSSTCAAGD